MKQFSSIVQKNEKICTSFYELEFSWCAASLPDPGQFLTLRISTDPVPLLRRPFAVSGIDLDKKTCSIIYQKRGRATELLAGKALGDNIDVIGPLGKSFPLPPKETEAILIAGGIGLGPILFLTNKLRAAGTKCRFIFGCRSESLIPKSASFTNAQPVICTDDGSYGFKGTTTDYLHSIAQHLSPDSILYCCGPHPMLHSCHQFATQTKHQCWVSVEQVMACGVGACMGCVVQVVKDPGYARACKEGPVFESSEMVWK